MWNRPMMVGCCVLATVASVAFPAAAVELTQAHDPLLLNAGFSGWSYDTGWMGTTVAGIGVYVRLFAAVGGTAVNLSASGAGKLLHPTAPDTAQLWFEGTSGSAEQNIGIQWSGQYKFVIGGVDYIGNLPYISSTDLRLLDSETFTPYLPEENIVLTDQVDKKPIYTWPVGVPGVFDAHIGLSADARDRIEIDPKALYTDKGTITVDGQRLNVPASGTTVAVNDIYETFGITPTMTIRPYVRVGITVIVPLDVDIPTFDINIPLSSLLQPEYPTTPSRSITFNLPPVIQAFAINNGASLTMGRVVNLNSTVSNNPTHYMASEDPSFAGAVWLPYAMQDQFTLYDSDRGDCRSE